MHTEISKAAEFLAKLLPSTITEASRDRFRQILCLNFRQKFESHWNPENPMIGNAYRSILIHNGMIDPLLLNAAEQAGITNIARSLPLDFVIWIDPFNVSYRIGERGSICTLYEEYNMDSAASLAEEKSQGLLMAVS